jgi:hypothetical protein
MSAQLLPLPDVNPWCAGSAKGQVALTENKLALLRRCMEVKQDEMQICAIWYDASAKIYRRRTHGYGTNEVYLHNNSKVMGLFEA